MQMSNHRQVLGDVRIMNIINIIQEKSPKMSAMWSRRHVTAGFTLTELLVTMSIAGILAMIAIPSFSGLTAMERAKTTSTDLYVALIRTRSEALKFNQSVSLSAKAGGWQNGWEMLNPSTGTVMEDHGPLNGVTVTTASGPGTIVYNSYGRVQGGTTSLQITTTNSNPVSRCVTVDTSGRPYTKASSC
jgi:type IV fimbrial biogenesis protein FimT